MSIAREMIFQKLRNWAARRHELPPQSGYIAIFPAALDLFPSDAPAQLNSFEMSDEAPAQSHRAHVPIVFLDSFENCPANSQAIRTVTERLFRKGMMDTYDGETYGYGCVIGGPGVKGFYLPKEMAELAPMVARAATVAACNGELGHTFHELTLRREPRPHRLPDWHDHNSCTNLICASEVSGDFVSSFEKTGKGKRTHATCVSPIAGMPVAIRTAKHTRPYDETATGAKSDVVLVYGVENQTLNSNNMPPILRKHPLARSLGW